MKSKSWRNIGIVLAALVVIYLYTKLQEARYTTPSDSVFDIQADEVSRFVIQEGDQRLELVRYDTLWVVTDHQERKVRQWRLDGFFNTVLGVERESMISENPDKWTTYGVDDSTGRHLQVYDVGGALAADLVVGQSSANWQSSYVREEGQDKVYLTTRSIAHFLSTDTTYWLEPLPEPEESEEDE
ncbi:MAG: DUF4340 domain-containing protein [Fidelibacterota bacterium]|nr:MAG: DUF4340 domain-containing protein [Candidatus Neomarinimicrobiota bacterium]